MVSAKAGAGEPTPGLGLAAGAVVGGTDVGGTDGVAVGSGRAAVAGPDEPVNRT